RYRVARQIKRGRSGSATTNEALWRADGEGWRQVDLDERVEAWAERMIGMPFETFQASILLRQGEADAFLNAPPRDRREALLKLVRLDDYRTLHRLASEKRSEARKAVSTLDVELETVADVTQETLDGKTAERNRLRRERDEARAAVTVAKTRVASAMSAAELRQQIAAQEATLQKHQALLSRAGAIEAAAARYHELQGILPTLRELHAAREEGRRADTRRVPLAEERATLEAAADERAVSVQQAEAAFNNAEKGRARVEEATKNSNEAKTIARTDLRSLQDEIKRHDTIVGTPTCPLCAADLDSDEGRRRVQHHYDSLRTQASTIAQRLAELEDEVKQSEATLASARTAEMDARDVLLEARAKVEAANARLRKLPGLIADVEHEVCNAEARAKQAEADLPTDWRDHPATSDTQARERVAEEAESLASAPDELEALSGAHREAGPAQIKISTLREQLGAIPEVDRDADPEALGHALAEAIKMAEALDHQVENVSQSIGQIEKALEAKGDLLKRRDAQDRLADLYKRLAEALGPKHLQARVLRDAQVRVRQNANATLHELTNGGWEITLAENGDDLHILARDPRGVERDFSYLSGGERFRVSVALAVGIGQSATGIQAVRTLLIDEGFGALDDHGRGLMVEELRRLSQKVLDGGRIVVVAHQDDVKDQFDYRFHIEKPVTGPSAGRAIVTRSMLSDIG
ncbi:MAG: SMC family ATPase, partial [Bacteroidota bacterium]